MNTETSTPDSDIKHRTCRGVALECINQNAESAGCVPPSHGHWIESDTIIEWNATVGELVDLYLSDGTSSHYCD
jgi:hypothetical protein